MAGKMVDQLRELTIQLGDLHRGSEVMEPVAGLFAVLYRSRRWGSNGAPEWAAFVEAEGLRVEDLDPQPGREVVRAFVCALLDAGLTQRDAAVVAGVAQKTVSRYFRAAISETGPEAQSPLLAGSISARGQISDRDYANAVVAELMAGVASVPPDPESALIQAAEHLKSVPGYFSVYGSGLDQGGQVGPGVDHRLRQLHRQLQQLVDVVRVLGQDRGVRL